MSFGRIIVILNGAVALISGIACAVAPQALVDPAGLSATPAGLTEIRAFYGGTLIGLGCFLIWCARETALTRAALLLMAVSVGSIGVLRVAGMLIDGAPTAYHAMNLAIEVTTVSLALFAISRSTG